MRTYELRMTLGKTKGADLFTIQTLVEMNEEDGIPMLMTRLAVAVRKKLLIFVWKDTEFLETKVHDQRVWVCPCYYSRSRLMFPRNLIYRIASRLWPGWVLPRSVWAFQANTH